MSRVIITQINVDTTTTFAYTIQGGMVAIVTGIPPVVLMKKAVEKDKVGETLRTVSVESGERMFIHNLLISKGNLSLQQIQNASKRSIKKCSTVIVKARLSILEKIGLVGHYQNDADETIYLQVEKKKDD